MHYLYARKQSPDEPWRLVATFDSQQQLLAYASWATLKSLGPRAGKFEQGSALAGYHEWKDVPEALPEDQQADVPHNPTPSML